MGVRLVVRATGADSNPEFEYAFDQQRIVIGRSAGADVCLPHPAVSSKHATITLESTGPRIEDGGSTNGTWVNGERIPPGRPKRLRTGDRILCGTFDLQFEGPLPIAQLTSEGRTASLARRIVREALAERPVGPPSLAVTTGPDIGAELALPFPPARLTIGRGEHCDLILSDGDVSREHVEVLADLDGFEVRDLESKNGLLVGDRRVNERRLRTGDVLRLGATELTFHDPAETAVVDLLQRDDEPAAPPRQETVEPKGDDEGPQPPPEDDPPQRLPPPKPAPAKGFASADIVIYLLSGVVLLLSVAALVYLLRA